MPPKKKPAATVVQNKGPSFVAQKKKPLKSQKVPWQLMRKAKKLGVSPEVMLQQEFPVSNGAKHQAIEKDLETRKNQLDQLRMQLKQPVPESWGNRSTGALGSTWPQSNLAPTWPQSSQPADYYRDSSLLQTWPQNYRMMGQYKDGLQSWTQDNRVPDQYNEGSQMNNWSQNNQETGQFKDSQQENTLTQNNQGTDQQTKGQQTQSWTQSNQRMDQYKENPQNNWATDQDNWAQSDQTTNQYKDSSQMDTWSQNNRGTNNYRDNAQMQSLTYDNWGTESPQSSQTWSQNNRATSQYQDSSRMQTSTQANWGMETWSENNQDTGYYRENSQMQPWTQNNRGTSQNWTQNNRATGHYTDNQQEAWASNSRITGQFTERRQMETWTPNNHLTGHITESRQMETWARNSRMPDQYMETWGQNSLLPDPYMHSEVDPWEPSSNSLSQYKDLPGFKALSSIQQSPGYKEWIRKERYRRLALNPTFGLRMLKRMGWRPGEGLGKEKKGMVEPLMPYMDMEQGYGPNPANLFASQLAPKPPKIIRPKDLIGKHPVSALIELCTNRGWQAPRFDVLSKEGPEHKKTYRMKVTVNKREYVSPKETPTKKEAKALVAELCLHALGMLPRKPSVPTR
ncbi:uncharacterized protein [Panulirus ornatus]|uniref:uncharacterized protein isoform X1 n=2 Tax=Panulirus ornatus TaxID=150431 RepID=UPI003A83AC24